MILDVKGEYHNGPAGLHFSGAGTVDIDDWKAQFLLTDAPENFAVHAPIETVTVVMGAPVSEDAETKDKALDEPTKDKQVKAAPKKK